MHPFDQEFVVLHHPTFAGESVRLPTASRSQAAGAIAIPVGKSLGPPIADPVAMGAVYSGSPDRTCHERDLPGGAWMPVLLAFHMALIRGSMQKIHTLLKANGIQTIATPWPGLSCRFAFSRHAWAVEHLYRPFGV